VEFRKFLDVIESQVPAGLDVHLIVDNYATHKAAIIRKWFAKRPRLPGSTQSEPGRRSGS